ncbi:MAG: sulfotransferase domain-containing protein [Pseudomonadales bacterium]|jgi:hypothetical protein|nr:sulfotransferase domain-containing protein [Pseudomonadales bacterium]
MTTSPRARTIEEFVANLSASPDEAGPNFKAYAPQSGDVFITSWAKSGTTLLQQMFHQLRTGGDMDFDDISRVTPWDDTALMLDFDMTAQQVASPRGFKSHRDYQRLPSGMRYSVSLRDPKETYVSFYRFMEGWQIEPGAIPMEEFLPIWMSGGPGGCDYATHLLSWYARREEADTLLATYPWVVKNRAEMIRRMAELCDIELTAELADLVLHRTSREYMVAHKDKFDDAMVSAALERKHGIPADSDSSKVQAQGSDVQTLPESVAQAIDAIWAEQVAPVTGHADFASLARSIDEPG